jgi:hypothetical protein
MAQSTSESKMAAGNAFSDRPLPFAVPLMVGLPHLLASKIDVTAIVTRPWILPNNVTF